MKETITEIKETTKLSGIWQSFSGFSIKTTKQEIFLGISNRQQCFENCGCFMTNDKLESFIGADLLEVKVVDESLRVETLEGRGYEDERSTMFVNLETSEGTLQFTAYNSHNGYYGHTAIVISDKLTCERDL